MTRVSALVLVGLALLASEPAAAVRRALLVGIDLYRPDGLETEGRGWWNLRGAVSDVEQMREILVARYGFEPPAVRLLTDREATRENILAAIRSHLVEPTRDGDVVVFYYAGHGSQVLNSSSPEADRLDETIVPADSHAGARDIRDKELRRLFNDVIDRGGLLTAFFDSCSSGSIARGLPRPIRTRFLAPDPRGGEGVAPEKPDGREPPEQRGALVFSAAQSWQGAAELRFREGRGRERREWSTGAFSLGLRQALQTAPFEASAEEILLRARAGVKGHVPTQEPVLAGPAGRQLFGPARGENDGRTLVAVVSRRREPLRVLGGRAVGLHPGSRLERVGGDGESVSLRVVEVEGMASSRVEVVSGEPGLIRSGDLFTPVNWVVPDEAQLRVWHPPPSSLASLRRLARDLEVLAEGGAVEWIDDPTATTPTHVLTRGETGWSLVFPGGRSLDLEAEPSARQLEQVLGGEGHPRLFVGFPPPAELASALGLAVGSAVEPAEQAEDAHYLVVGRVLAGALEYALVLPNQTQEDRAAGRSPLPARTDWMPVADDAAGAGARLGAEARKLGRIRGWLRLESPPESAAFPYRLAIRDLATGAIVSDRTVTGRSYQLVLRAAESDLERPFEARYVYVFAIDSFGRRTLLFPRGGQGNAGNRVGAVEGEPSLGPELPLGPPFEVGPPFGIDTFFLLSTRTPIASPDVLAGAGVRTRGAGSSPLERLVTRIDAGTRGESQPLPTSWSIQRLPVRSTPRDR